MKHFVHAASVVVALFAMTGCDRRDRANETSYSTPTPVEPKSNVEPPKEEVPPASPTPSAVGGGPMTPAVLPLDGAFDRIAQASCDLAAKCDYVGKGKKEGAYGDCMKKSTDRLTKNVKDDTCPHGVDGAKLAACLDEMHGESCDRPEDVIDRMQSCRTTVLCAP